MMIKHTNTKIVQYIILIICVWSIPSTYALGSKFHRDGTPKTIGIVLFSENDFFIQQARQVIIDKAYAQHIKINSIVTDRTSEAQLEAINTLIDKKIGGLIVEALNSDTMNLINDLVIEHNTPLVYILEEAQFSENAIQKNRRINSMVYSTNIAQYQIDYTFEYFKENNITSGDIFIIYNENDPKQLAHAEYIAHQFDETKTNRMKVSSLSLVSYQQTLDSLKEQLSKSNKVNAIYTTNNELTEWTYLSIKNYKLEKNFSTGPSLRRSPRRTRSSQIKSKSRKTSSRTSSNTSSLDKLIIISNEIDSRFIHLIKNKELHMAIYHNGAQYGTHVFDKLIRMSQGKKETQVGFYYPDIITPQNIFNFAAELRIIEEQM